MKYIKAYEENEYKIGEYVKLRISYNDYYNKFYLIKKYLSGLNKYLLIHYLIQLYFRNLFY